MVITRYFEKILGQRLQERLNFIQVVIGPRQVGKTTGVQALYQKHQGPKLFISADSPVPHSADWLASHWRQAQRLGDNVLLIVDEIQKVTGWAETCKFLFDEHRAQRQMKVVLLGSASLSIQEGLASSLAGRFELIKVEHWTFPECRQAFGWNLDTYLKFGGYPAAAELLPDLHRWQAFIKDSIIEPVLGRDISGLVRINNPALFRQSFRLALQYPAGVISYQKLLGQLQDKGNAATMKHYLEFFEAAFLLKKLEKFSSSSQRSAHSSPKLLPLAPALCNAFLDDIQRIEDPAWQGHIFECVVGAHLLTLPGKLFYWSEGSFEVDFVRVADQKIHAYEVKSGVNYKSKSLERFRKKFPRATIEVIDRQNVLQWLG